MARMRRTVFCTLALSCLLQAQSLLVAEHKLENGMRILIQEDHDIPNVAMYLFYKIGARNERPGTTGLSHFFEHMMFNGAEKYGPKQFDIQMEKAGGNNNAYTSQDLTVYTDWFPRSALELMFDMEADRIEKLAFDPKIVESERGVVYSERRTSVENNNASLLREQLYAAAYTAHPYGWPVVGWSSDIESWSLEDLKVHYRMGYAPNNCLVVICGDVTEAEVLALAKKYFERIPKSNPPPEVKTQEPPQLGERRVEIRKTAQLPLFAAGYHVPESRHADRAALEVLENILSGGRSSRLYRRFVDGQLALSAFANVPRTLNPGLMSISIRPRAGVTPAEIERVLDEELEKLRTGQVSAEEVEKAQNQILAETYRSLTTIAGKANLLGLAEIYYGSYKKLFDWPQEVKKVTAEDVKRAANVYLTKRNRTVAVLIPEENRPQGGGK